MDVLRLTMYVAGFIFVIFATWLLFVETGVSAYIPIGIYVGFAILIGGLALIGAAAIFAEDRTGSLEQIRRRARRGRRHD